MIEENKMLLDQEARTKAIDPAGSFIIQAPAGSGKTQLLITRFLNLLLVVKRPEEILALTFTKKAAAEMQHRIITTLKNAQTLINEGRDPSNTLEEIACKVLLRDQQKNWNLLKNISQCRIMTLDAFCNRLTQRLSFHSSLRDLPNITSQPYFYYSKAVDEFLEEVEENSTLSQMIQSIFENYDHHWKKVKSFFIKLLEVREQWLIYFPAIHQDNFKDVLEYYLSRIIQQTLEQAFLNIPSALKKAWIELFIMSAENLAHDHQHFLSSILQDHLIEKFPEPQADTLPIWRALIDYVLTKEGSFRSQLNKNLGFFSVSTTKDKNEKEKYKVMKENMQDLLQSLASIPNLEETLIKIRTLPEAHLSKFQCESLKALVLLLPALNQKLKKIFFQFSVADFTHIQLAALEALGATDDPSELLLEFDEKINHILIDEFQDTSNTQYRFLETLTSGWQLDEGRTLFLVGDPQQSIYGFRAAEVGLFLKAQQEGISNIPLKTLRLTMNFRSTPLLVEWHNKIFEESFPTQDDISCGAISFSKSHALEKNSHPESTINFYVKENSFLDDLAQMIQKKRLLYPDATIALLVRNRHHALPILNTFQSLKIPYVASGIEFLHEHPAILDLLSLMRALLHPSDRVAWLSVLRAPWCGLVLSDLLIISENKNECIFDNLQNSFVFTKLSADGQSRIKNILVPLIEATHKVGQIPLDILVEKIWLDLDGPATLKHPEELMYVSEFFKAISDFSKKNGLFFEYEFFWNEFKNRSLDIKSNDKNPIQVMTIHKAKGLEFDYVFLLGLERKQKENAYELLLWHEFVSLHQPCFFLLAPLYHRNTKDETLYRFIRTHKKQKQDYEELRLFYVAATRAKQQLHIFIKGELKEGKPFLKNPSLLMRKLFPFMTNQLTYLMDEPSQDLLIDKTLAIKKYLQRFKLPLIQKIILKDKYAADENKLSLLQSFPYQSHHLEKITGLVLHEMMQDFTQFGLEKYLKDYESIFLKKYNQRLREYGLTEKKLNYVLDILQQSFENLSKDSRAKWLCDPSHLYSQSEWELLSLQKEASKLWIVDRTFIEYEIRWIIDYKTSIPQNKSLDNFLEDEKLKYNEQLRQYAITIQHFDFQTLNRTYPIHCGLYFPRTSLWIEWEFLL